MKRLEQIKISLKQGKSILHYPEIMDNRDMVLFAIKENIQNYEVSKTFTSDKEFSLLAISLKTSAALKMSEELKKDISFAKDVAKIKTDALYFFDKNIQFSNEIMAILLNVEKTHNDAIKYLREIKKIDSEKYYSYFEKFPNVYSKITTAAALDLRLLKIILKNPKYASVALVRIEKSPSKTFDIDMECLVLVLNAREIQDNKSIIWKDLKERIRTNDSNMEMFVREYKYNISPSIMKILLKNEKFNMKYGEMYKNNKQKKDYHSLIREIDLIEKIEKIDKEEIIRKPRVKI